MKRFKESGNVCHNVNKLCPSSDGARDFSVLALTLLRSSFVDKHKLRPRCRCACPDPDGNCKVIITCNNVNECAFGRAGRRPLVGVLTQWRQWYLTSFFVSVYPTREILKKRYVRLCERVHRRLWGTCNNRTIVPRKEIQWHNGTPQEKF